MEHMSAQGTWAHEGWAEYADHSLTHDDVPDAVVEAARSSDTPAQAA
jgi:hypothetical protein